MGAIRRLKKHLAAAVIFVLLVATMTGCMGQRGAISFHEDGSCGYSIKYLFEKTMYDDMVPSEDTLMIHSGDFQKEIENINGKEYNTFSRDLSFANYNEMIDFLTRGAAYRTGLQNNSLQPKYYDDVSEAPFSSITMDASGFVGTLNPDGDFAFWVNNVTGDDSSKIRSLGYDSYSAYSKSVGIMLDITVTLPTAVTESNGVVTDKTVSWTLESIPADRKLIAAASGNPISTDVTPPTVDIDGVRGNGLYGSVKITGKDDVSLKSLVLDGFSQDRDTVYVTGRGKHTVTAIDYNNNSTTVNFRIDGQKPKIRGAKNGKTYRRPVTLKFSDNMGIRDVIVNGKKIKSKKKVTLKKTGTYTVSVVDKNFNHRSISFRIKTKK